MLNNKNKAFSIFYFALGLILFLPAIPYANQSAVQDKKQVGQFNEAQDSEASRAVVRDELPANLTIKPEGIDFASEGALAAPSVAGALMPAKGPAAGPSKDLPPDTLDAPTHREAVP